MTNEHDVIIAKIGAALQVMNMSFATLEDCKIKSDAEEFLTRQFAPPEPQQLTAEQFVRRNTMVGERCPKIVPGRGSLKREDAIRCSKQTNHEGPCNFGNG